MLALSTDEEPSMDHQLPPLPYALDALEPHLSKETLEFHHGKHHAAYVTKLNSLIKDTEFASQRLVEIVAQSSGELFDNAAQAWNHAFYWHCLAPNAGGRPTGALAAAIDNRWGSFAAFQDAFKKAAVSNFGSGWTWLVKKRNGALDIVSTSNAGTPITGLDRPLLTCDVWEHAYYIDYRNQRPEYLNGFWNLVNWEFVARNLSA
jgi:superoxide dismutase, Fe-Mn family